MLHFLRPFSGESSPTPPCWFMRQAGRYLPEYRALREEAGGFLKMCYTPELATEITLQPIRRFGMDAAIIFSDILVIPHGLGRELEFITGSGPHLEVISSQAELELLSCEHMETFLQPVYQAISDTREKLPEQTALIGFAGAPWTLLCYMMDGNGKEQFMQARSAIYRQPALVDAAIDLLCDAISQHLCAQIKAGANAVQLFDSWAAHVPATHREALIFAPTRRIVQAVRAEHPDVPILCFPRGIGEADMVAFVHAVQPDGLSVDQHTDIEALAEVIPAHIVLQGNLDPLQLIHDQERLCQRATELASAMAHRPFVMNLGHGVLPPTPPEHMAALVATIQQDKLA